MQDKKRAKWFAGAVACVALAAQVERKEVTQRNKQYVALLTSGALRTANKVDR